MLKQLCYIKYLLILTIFLSISIHAKSQHSINDTIKVYAFITPNGDTIPMGYLPDVQVQAKLNREQKKRQEEWTRLRNAVYVTYPYARAAGLIMNDINAQLVHVTDKNKRKAIIKSKEKELKKEFTDKLKQLSIYQGKVLMKLINRQTGNNCYEIIQEYKGSFTATFYQTVAFVFGTNLKQPYDPKGNGNDADIEKIVKDVERMYGIRS